MRNTPMPLEARTLLVALVYSSIVLSMLITESRIHTCDSFQQYVKMIPTVQMFLFLLVFFRNFANSFSFMFYKSKFQ